MKNVYQNPIVDELILTQACAICAGSGESSELTGGGNTSQGEVPHAPKRLYF